MEFNKEWLAGFFDGEGSIGIYPRNYDRTKQFKYYVLVVSVAQSGNIGEQIVNALEHKYGGSSYCQEKEGVKLQWKWNISADKAANFLNDIYEFLIIKKEEARLGIEFQKLESKKLGNFTAENFAEEVKKIKVNY